MTTVWTLLRRGLLVGALAGLVAGSFAFVFGEPLLQDAINLEATGHAQASLQLVAPFAHASEGVISRPQQRGGLFLATALYGLSVGLLFAMVFAFLRGRGAQRDDWQLATRLAAGLFIAGVLIPFLKYPANPPGVGSPDTIGERTEYFMVMLVGSLLALLAAARVMWSVKGDPPPWKRPVLGAATFVIVAGGLALALPGIQEVPATFPAALLWEFRISSLGTQLVLWSSLGVGYGIACLRAETATARSAARQDTATAT